MSQFWVPVYFALGLCKWGWDRMWETCAWIHPYGIGMACAGTDELMLKPHENYLQSGQKEYWQS